MTDTWTAQDDAILEARSRAKQASDMVAWPTVQEESVGVEGTTVALHHPGHLEGAYAVSWGFCSEVVAAPDSPEVVMRSSLGGRVRAGSDAGLERALAQANRVLADPQRWVGLCDVELPPFAYVREGDRVYLETRFCPDEITDEQQRWISHFFDQWWWNISPAIEARLADDHVDDDCACDGCIEEYVATLSPEERAARQRADQEDLASEWWDEEF